MKIFCTKEDCVGDTADGRMASFAVNLVSAGGFDFCLRLILCEKDKNMKKKKVKVLVCPI